MDGFKSLISRRLRITSGPGALSRLRRGLREVLVLDLRRPEARAMAMLAVEEAVANILEHGYGNRAGLPVEITLRIGEGERFAVVLRDRAPVVDVTTLPPRDLDRLARDLATRGRGLAMVRRIAESMRHRPRRGGGNELTLFFDAERLAGGAETLSGKAA